MRDARLRADVVHAEIRRYVVLCNSYRVHFFMHNNEIGVRVRCNARRGRVKLHFEPLLRGWEEGGERKFVLSTRRPGERARAFVNVFSSCPAILCVARSSLQAGKCIYDTRIPTPFDRRLYLPGRIYTQYMIAYTAGHKGIVW